MRSSFHGMSVMGLSPLACCIFGREYDPQILPSNVDITMSDGMHEYIVVVVRSNYFLLSSIVVVTVWDCGSDSPTIR